MDVLCPHHYSLTCLKLVKNGKLMVKQIVTMRNVGKAHVAKL
jgi:hypothetical protein